MRILKTLTVIVILYTNIVHAVMMAPLPMVPTNSCGNSGGSFSFTWGVATNQQTYCYVSNSCGEVPAGSYPAPATCCDGDFKTVTHYKRFGNLVSKKAGCYAVTNEGVSPAGERPVDDVCCPQ